MTVFSAFLLIAAAVPATAPAAADLRPATEQPADQDARLALAMQLIKLVNPDDRLLTQEMRGWELGMRHMIAADPALVELEKQFPGVSEAGIDAARPAAREYLTGAISKMKRFKAEAMARLLTLAELRDTHDFYTSPAGRRLALGMTAPEQADHLVQQVAARAEESGDTTITARDSEKALGAAVGSVFGKAPPEDLVEIMRFEATSAGKKLRMVAAETQEYTLKMANSPDPEFLERQQSAVMEGMLAFAERAAKSQ